MNTNKDIFHLSVDRHDLDKLIEHFSNAGLADLVVDKEGQIVFNIRKNSSLKIKPINPTIKISKEILKMKQKRKKIETGTTKRKTLDIKIKHFEMVTKLLNT